jgi:hypothetical protein
MARKSVPRWVFYINLVGMTAITGKPGEGLHGASHGNVNAPNERLHRADLDVPDRVFN